MTKKKDPETGKFKRHEETIGVEDKPTPKKKPERLPGPPGSWHG